MMKYVYTLSFLFFIAATLCTAASDEFQVRLLVGSDTTPPSTPTSLVALPVSQTQIDLSWGVSTDDVLLSGYQVFRDSIQIATTTLTTYSDSGLTANTSYSYFIKAFDSSFNISSSSNSVATSTFSITATTTATSSASYGGNSKDIRLVLFKSIPALESVTLLWETNTYAQFELRWGRTASYELGFVANTTYKKQHATAITDLEPGTTYEFELIAYDRNGVKQVLKRGQFKTLDAPDTTAPTNVGNLRATADGDNVLLTWDNPADADFSHVRIVRSHLFYPNDPADGFIAYEGSSNSTYDARALSLNNIEYYTVFSYDTNGNISSGAIVSVRKKNTPIDSDDVLYGTPATSTSSPVQFSDIEFIQEGIEVDSTDIDGFIPLVVRIPYSVFPEHLKSITVTFTHPYDTDLTFSFLLRINKDKTYYEALIAPLRIMGIYPVRLSLYDHQTKKVYAVDGTVNVQKQAKVSESKNIEDSSIVSLLLRILWLIIVAVFVFWVCLLIVRKNRRSQNSILK